MSNVRHARIKNMHLHVAYLMLVMVLSVTPVFVRSGKWLGLCACAFVLAEIILIAWVEREIGQPGSDGPAVMLVGLVFLVPGALFTISLSYRLIRQAINHLLQVRSDLVHYRQVISQAKKSR
jgi:hypothetical protein